METINNNGTEEVRKEYVVKTYKSFDDLDLKENLHRGISSYNFKIPSRIQGIAIKPIIDRIDMIAQSQSGTGKTGTFSIGVLQRIDETKQYPQAIILSHTRELAEQIQCVVEDIGKYMGIKTSLCVGKNPIYHNISSAKKAQILIGTPGRMIDILSRNVFNIDNINLMVMDEADALMGRDFQEQVKKIIKFLAGSCQICLFSATLPREVMFATKNFLNNPLKLLIEKDKLTLDLIHQYYIEIPGDDKKLLALEDLYGKFSINQCIIYVNSIDKAEWLKEELLTNSYTTEVIHSRVELAERTKIMKNFRASGFRVLISTDLLARGIDFQQVGYVINFDMPMDPETYLHRIGRSGRFNKKGVSINFIGSRKDKLFMRDIEKHYRIEIPAMPEPHIINAYLTS
jgi:superfamily II DNA/RNA helicase